MLAAKTVRYPKGRMIAYVIENYIRGGECAQPSLGNENRLVITKDTDD